MFWEWIPVILVYGSVYGFRISFFHWEKQFYYILTMLQYPSVKIMFSFPMCTNANLESYSAQWKAENKITSESFLCLTHLSLLSQKGGVGRVCLTHRGRVGRLNSHSITLALRLVEMLLLLTVTFFFYDLNCSCLPSSRR